MSTATRKKYRARLIIRQPVFDTERKLVDYQWDSCEVKFSSRLGTPSIVGAEIISVIEEEVAPLVISDQNILQRPIIVLDISSRAINCLLSAGIKTIGDLVALHPIELRKHRGVGRTILGEYQKALGSIGLKLGMRAE